jgi:hypothetical protein
VIGAAKGTKEYQQILDKLMHTSYAHQASEAKPTTKADEQHDESCDDIEDNYRTEKALVPEAPATSQQRQET